MSDDPIFFGVKPFNENTISEIERQWDSKISPQDISRDLDVSVIQIWQTVLGKEKALEKVVNFHKLRGVSNVSDEALKNRTTGDPILDKTLGIISFLKHVFPGFREDLGKLSDQEHEMLKGVLTVFFNSK